MLLQAFFHSDAFETPSLENKDEGMARHVSLAQGKHSGDFKGLFLRQAKQKYLEKQPKLSREPSVAWILCNCYCKVLMTNRE